MKYVWSYLIISGIALLALYGVYFCVPEIREVLLMEDGIIENVGALIFLGAFLLGIPLCVKTKAYRRSILFISLVALVGFLDEISFGERWIEIKMPELLGVKIDGVHDLFYMVAINLDRAPRLHAIGFSAVCFIVFVWVTLKYGRRLMRWALDAYPRPTLILAALFFLQLGMSLVIDLEVVRRGWLFVLEEQFEANVAMALAFCSLSLYHPDVDEVSGNESL